MVTGHIDEIGFVVTRIDDKGLLRFEQVGGWDLSVPAGQRVRVLTRDGVRRRHGRQARAAPDEGPREGARRSRTCGSTSASRTATRRSELVRIGDPIVLDTTPHVFANRRVMSRSVDDRIGAFIALEVARRAKGSDVEVVALCATREEIGCVGAMPGTYGADPDEAIAIDVTWTSDVPGDHAEDSDVGKGPTVTFGAATRARIGRELVAIAEDADIDIQIAPPGRYTGTDADTVVRAGRGVPVGVVSDADALPAFAGRAVRARGRRGGDRPARALGDARRADAASRGSAADRGRDRGDLPTRELRRPRVQHIAACELASDVRRMHRSIALPARRAALPAPAHRPRAGRRPGTPRRRRARSTGACRPRHTTTRPAQGKDGRRAAARAAPDRSHRPRRPRLRPGP